jgi:hypothetical protein
MKEKDRKKEEEEKRKKETANLMEGGMLMTPTVCCHPSLKNRITRGVTPISTSTTTTLPFSLQGEFPLYSFE